MNKELDQICSEAALKLEDNARKVGEVTSDAERAINLSIAISLKRIADVMTKKISMPELTPEELKAMEKQYNKGGSAFGISFKG